MDGKIGRTNIVPDIRPENIDKYTETNTQEDGMEQAAQYKIVDANPIIGGVLDRLAFFRTHASAVWYNKMKNITVLQKLDNLAGNIGTLTQLATTDKTSLVNAINELNANIGKKQDASTAITTGNIGQQSVKHATTAGSASAVAWGNVSGKPGTYPPSGHNHDDRYYTETEVNAKINNLKKVELILPYSDLTSSTKTFALSKNWASFKYVWVGLACNSDNVFLWKSGLIIPTEMLKIAHGNYQVSCIYDLTDFYVNAEVDFSNANHINSRITSHGSDAGFSNARIYVFGLEEP